MDHLKLLRVVIESPYAGDVQRNKEYAKRCMKHSLMRNESPYLSHLLYTQVLDDTNPIERSQGITAALSWIYASNKTAVYTDYGISNGMQQGINYAEKLKHTVEYRQIGKNEKVKTNKLFVWIGLGILCLIGCLNCFLLIKN